MPVELAERTLASRDGLTLGYLEQGTGTPAVLLHGITASAHINWVDPGVAERLTGSKLRVVALDFRGHGRSEAPSDSSSCSFESLIDDTVDLVEGSSFGPCHLVGYSLGALVALHVAARGALPLRRVVLAGINPNALTLEGQDPQIVDAMVDALLAPDPGSIADPATKAYRQQVDAWGAHPASVAALVRDLQSPHEVPFGAIDVPVLVVNGDNDASAQEMAGKIPGAAAETVGGDHMTAPFDPRFADVIAKFLTEGP